MEKYKSLNHDSRIPGLQHMKVLHQQRAMDDLHDAVPEMIYSPMMAFERTFLCQKETTFCCLSCLFERNKKQLDGFRYLITGIF
jgi:hypothetical protein